LAFYSVIIIGVTIAFIAWYFDRIDFYSAKQDLSLNYPLLF
jgi:hypothetical protein